MTQEQKDLVFRAICMYLPYKPLIHIHGQEFNGKKFSAHIEGMDLQHDPYSIIAERIHLPYEDFSLYLRPVSQIDEELFIDNEFITISDEMEIEKYLRPEVFSKVEYWVEYLPFELVQILLKCHIDIFGLLEQGLAIEIPLQ